MNNPKGSYIKTSRNIKIENNRLYADLKTFDGTYHRDCLFLNEENKNTEFHNNNGCFYSETIFIPKKIFQTQKTREYVKNHGKILNAVKSWSSRDDFEYFFFDDQECFNFISDNFDENVLKAYEKCPVPVMKADLWRYCVIYKNGGIYADCDTICNIDPNVFLKNKCQLVCAPENNVHLCQWFFAAPKESPILKSIIDLSVQRILNTEKIIGPNIIHHLTGPGVFTDAIQDYLRKKEYPIFKDKIDYINYPFDDLYVINNQFFHTCLVKHLFSGQFADGWTKVKLK